MLFIYSINGQVLQTRYQFWYNECKSDEVDRLNRFNEYVASKLVRVNNLWSIIRFVTDYTEVIDTPTSLNITQERFNQRNKLCPCERIVELKQLEFERLVAIAFSRTINRRTLIRLNADGLPDKVLSPNRTILVYRVNDRVDTIFVEGVPICFPR